MACGVVVGGLALLVAGALSPAAWQAAAAVRLTVMAGQPMQLAGTPAFVLAPGPAIALRQAVLTAQTGGPPLAELDRITISPDWWGLVRGEYRAATVRVTGGWTHVPARWDRVDTAGLAAGPTLIVEDVRLGPRDDVAPGSSPAADVTLNRLRLSRGARGSLQVDAWLDAASMPVTVALQHTVDGGLHHAKVTAGDSILSARPAEDAIALTLAGPATATGRLERAATGIWSADLSGTLGDRPLALRAQLDRDQRILDLELALQDGAAAWPVAVLDLSALAPARGLLRGLGLSGTGRLSIDRPDPGMPGLDAVTARVTVTAADWRGPRVAAGRGGRRAAASPAPPPPRGAAGGGGG